MVKSTKGKALTVANIKKEQKNLSERLDVTVFSSTTGDSYEIKVDKKLRKTKITDMISEMMTQLQFAKKNEIDLQHVFFPYSIFMMIKHFTSLGDSIPSDISSQIQIMRNLIDLDLLQPILEVFPEEDAEEVFTTIAEVIESTDRQVKEMADRIEEMQRAYDEGDLSKVLDLGEDDYIEYETVEEDEPVSE